MVLQDNHGIIMELERGGDGKHFPKKGERVSIHYKASVVPSPPPRACPHPHPHSLSPPPSSCQTISHLPSLSAVTPSHNKTGGVSVSSGLTQWDGVRMFSSGMGRSLIAATSARGRLFFKLA